MPAVINVGQRDLGRHVGHAVRELDVSIFAGRSLCARQYIQLCTVQEFVYYRLVSSTGRDIDLDGLSRLGSALSDHTRRRLLVALSRGPGYPAELAVELDESRQSISNHLACLRGCGLVVAFPEGRRMRYELVDDRLATALRELVELTVAVDPQHLHEPEHRA